MAERVGFGFHTGIDNVQLIENTIRSTRANRWSLGSRYVGGTRPSVGSSEHGQAHRHIPEMPGLQFAGRDTGRRASGVHVGRELAVHLPEMQDGTGRDAGPVIDATIIKAEE